MPNIAFNLTYLSVTDLAKASSAPLKTQVKAALGGLRKPRFQYFLDHTIRDTLDIDSMLSMWYIDSMEFEKNLNDPVSRFALLVFRINALLMRNGEKITQSVGLSSAKWQILGRAGSASLSVAQMAREIGLTRQSVQRVADVLEKAGLVLFRDIPNDQRTFLVEITPKGRTVLKRIYELNSVWTNQVLKKVNSEVFTETALQLEQLSHAFEELENEEVRR